MKEPSRLFQFYFFIPQFIYIKLSKVKAGMFMKKSLKKDKEDLEKIFTAMINHIPFERRKIA